MISVALNWSKWSLSLACYRGKEKKERGLLPRVQLPCSASLGYRNHSAGLGINVDGPKAVNRLQAELCSTLGQLSNINTMDMPHISSFVSPVRGCSDRERTIGLIELGKG